jgi:hypothetical protein
MAVEWPRGSSGFVGRAGERRLVAERAAEAARARPWVVAVEGPAGMGKTAFVRAVRAELAATFTVARIAADDLARDQPMELLSQLVAVDASSPFAAGMGLLRHLNDLQDQGPVLLIVEDLHWADAESRQGLLVALRRLERDRVLALVTLRPHEVDDEGWHRLFLDAARSQRVVLGGLSGVECAEVAATAGIELRRGAAERLARHTAASRSTCARC